MAVNYKDSGVDVEEGYNAVNEYNTVLYFEESEDE